MKVDVISSDLLEYLKNNGQIKARVHSIFENSFNVIDKSNQLIGILSNTRDIAPMTMLVDRNYMVTLDIRLEDKILLNDKKILFTRDNKAISINPATVWLSEKKNSEKLNSESERLATLDEIKEKLISSGKKESLAQFVSHISFYKKGIVLEDAELSYYNSFISELLMKFINEINLKRYHEALKIVPNIIGFGPGLTPSIDDFLAGVMTTLSYASNIYEGYEEVEKFNEEISKESISKTTSISEHMLGHAAKGKVSSFYRKILVKIFFETPDIKLDEAIVNVLSHGANSGSDFLTGVYITSRIIFNQIKEEYNW